MQADTSKRTQRWGPLGVLAFWCVVMGVLYAAMAYYLKPKAVVVTAQGALVIPKARDGHFYAQGTVNGQSVRFMVDTGASLVFVSAPLARAAGLGQGVATVFKTANGDLFGQIVTGVPVTLGPVAVSSVRVGVGLVGENDADALLGQSFLAQFEVLFANDKMVLRPKTLSIQ